MDGQAFDGRGRGQNAAAPLSYGEQLAARMPLEPLVERELETARASCGAGGEPEPALGAALIPDPDFAERTWLAQFEIYVEAARNPALRPAVQRWREAFVDLAEQSLRAVDAPDPERRAPIAVAAINGILLDRLRGVGDDPARTMATRFNDLFALLLSG